MEQQPKLTVVIPHYNIPDLLMRCLDSIPVSPEIQVIVVDDCSPDADTYQERYPALSRPYLEMYTTPGSGDAGRARNIGIEHARGRWITFMDADDLFEDLAGVVANYLDRPEDVLFFKARAVMSDDLSKPSTRRQADVEGLNEAIEQSNIRSLRYNFNPLWGKFVKLRLIERHNMRCNHARYCNDAYLSVLIGVFAEKAGVIDSVAYITTERDGSLTSARDMSWEEFSIRLRSALLKQEVLDKYVGGCVGMGFATWLIEPTWHTNRRRYFKAMAMLSWRNRWRVVRYQLSKVKTNLKAKLK